MTTSRGAAPAEAQLIEAARKAKGMSIRQAAKIAAISEGRWRQIESGEQKAAGMSIPVVAPDGTLARMAQSLGISADQLREAGRPDAADALIFIAGMQTESDWQHVGTVLDRLVRLREELTSIINELQSGGGTGGGNNTAAIGD